MSDGCRTKEVQGKLKEHEVTAEQLLEAMKQFDNRGRGWIKKAEFSKIFGQMASTKLDHKQKEYAFENAQRVSLEYAQTADAPEWCKPDPESATKEQCRDVDGEAGYHIESVAKWMTTI